ncbi:MAG TPA: MFS transporter [Candidatus Angelobacter sp.]|nr:MFS transporter [Candidatus Angelobacter sp.]
MIDSTVRRNVFILALCQALAMTAMTITITVTALNGEALLTDKAWATVPLALQALATMLTTIPASALMRAKGRRFGFTLGALIGMAGGALGVLSVTENSFWLLCLANMGIGSAAGFAAFYRFAAADAASEAFRGHAISLVLTGGVAAAVFGPTLSQLSRELFPAYIFAGCYGVMIFLYAGIIALLPMTRIPSLSREERRHSGRPLPAILRQPGVAVALLAGMTGYGVMSFLMTATPLAMKHHHFAFSDWRSVIQWHALGMFLPSFATGFVIKRIGVLNVLWSGAALLFLAVAADLSGLGFWNFWVGLVVLGIGWNFLYVGGSTLLTESYRQAERAKVQGLNDFLIFGTVASSSFASGTLHSAFGWTAVNYGVLPLVAVTLVATLWLMGRRRRAIAAE